MDTSGLSRPVVSRRAFLGSFAGLSAGIGGVSQAATASADTTLTAMTRNVYLGIDLSALLQADSTLEFYTIVGRFLNEFDPAVYEARADAIAAEIDAEEVDVVGLQEAAMIRTERPSETGEQSTQFDFLTHIVSALRDRGLSYRVAAKTVTTDIELSAETSDGEVTLRLADREVLLVREGINVTETVADTYDETTEVEIPVNSREVTLRRGYCFGNIRTDGVDLAVGSTHLESISRDSRYRQAEELLSTLPSDQPVILCGDFNSGPGAATETYDLLTESLEDPYATLHPDRDGPTCCQTAGLQNDASRLDRRIDGTLYRGDLHPAAVGRVGHRADDRITIQSNGEMVRLWPSDHAGMVATFELPSETDSGMSSTGRVENETASNRRKRTGRDQNESGSVSESAAPGIGVSGTLAALCGFGYLVKRRTDQ